MADPLCDFDLNRIWYTVTLYAIAIISNTLGVFVLYIILKHSPKTFQAYKWNLLCYHLSCWMMDISLTIGTEPNLLMPFLIGYPSGLFRYTKLLGTFRQTGIVFSFIFATLANLIIFFVYRVWTVIPPWHPLYVSKKVYFILIIVLFLLSSLPLIIVFTLTTYDPVTDTAKAFTKKYPCISPYISIPGCIILDIDQPRIKGMLYVCAALALLMVLVIATCIFISLKVLGSANISSATRKLQRKLTTSLALQTLTPLLLIGIPFGACIVTTIYMIPGTQIVGDIFIICVSSHGSVSFVAILLFNAPYYKFLKDKLSKVDKYMRQICGMSTVAVNTSVVATWSSFSR